MNIAILSRSESLYSTKSLLKAGGKRDHTMEIIDPTYCELIIENGKAVVLYQDKIVDNLDAIIPRIGASNTYFGSSLVRHFEAMQVFSIVSSDAILQSRDKWTCFQILAKANVPLPKTIFGGSFNLEEQLKDFGENPVIIKLLEGTHGHGVILAETKCIGYCRNSAYCRSKVFTSRIYF